MSLRRLAILEAAFEIEGQGRGPHMPLHKFLPPSLEELQVEIPMSCSVWEEYHRGKPMMLHMLAEDGIWYKSQLHMVRTLVEHKEEYLPLLRRVVWWYQESADLRENNSY